MFSDKNRYRISRLGQTARPYCFPVYDLKTQNGGGMIFSSTALYCLEEIQSFPHCDVRSVRLQTKFGFGVEVLLLFLSSQGFLIHDIVPLDTNYSNIFCAPSTLFQTSFK